MPAGTLTSKLDRAVQELSRLGAGGARGTEQRLYQRVAGLGGELQLRIVELDILLQEDAVGEFHLLRALEQVDLHLIVQSGAAVDHHRRLERGEVVGRRHDDLAGARRVVDRERRDACQASHLVERQPVDLAHLDEAAERILVYLVALDGGVELVRIRREIEADGLRRAADDDGVAARATFDH
jgi:hypothetical protein